MLGYKNREVLKNHYSKAYFNLHKFCFSLKQKGLVTLHSEGIRLINVNFSVYEPDRQRVIREQSKNVHAYVNGYYTGIPERVPAGFRLAYYNPYKTSTFIDKETGEELTQAEDVILLNKEIWYK